jgi:aconitate hydratase
MGVLPLQFIPSESAGTLGITGREAFTIHGLDDLSPRARLTVTAQDDTGGEPRRFTAIARLDGPIDVEYYRQGGILPAVLRRLAATS